MTVHRAAKLYGIPYRTLLRYVKQGLIKSIPNPLDPRQVVIDPSEEDKLLALEKYYTLQRAWREEK